MIPTVWPSRSMNSKQIPSHIEGKLGYYCLANETSISQGSVKGAYEAVKVVLTATNMLEDEKAYLHYVVLLVIMLQEINMVVIAFLTTWL